VVSDGGGIEGYKGWLTVVMSMMFDEECLSATILPRLLMSTRKELVQLHSPQHLQ
jgi:hypothetical protein